MIGNDSVQKMESQKDIFQLPQTRQVWSVTGINNVSSFDLGAPFRAIQWGTVRPTGRQNASAAWAGTPRVFGRAAGFSCASAGVGEYETVST